MQRAQPYAPLSVVPPQDAALPTVHSISEIQPIRKRERLTIAAQEWSGTYKTESVRVRIVWQGGKEGERKRRTTRGFPYESDCALCVSNPPARISPTVIACAHIRTCTSCKNQANPSAPINIERERIAHTHLLRRRLVLVPPYDRSSDGGGGQPPAKHDAILVSDEPVRYLAL